MRGMMRLAIMGVPGAQVSGVAPITWLFKASFEGPDLAAGEVPASLGTPYVEVGGPLTMIQNDGQFRISGNKLYFPAQDTPTVGDQGFIAALDADITPGRALIATLTLDSMSNNDSILYFRKQVSLPSNHNFSNENNGAKWENQNFVALRHNNSQTLQVISSLIWQIAVVTLADGSGLWANGRLAWIDYSPSGYHATFSNATSSGAFDFLGVRDLPAPFLDHASLAIVNETAPVSGTPYTATADAIHDLEVTAPNPLSGSAGIKYRVTDENNYWTAYLNDAGTFRADSVAAGTPTNRVNVAGVAAAGQARTIRVICNGTKHNYYTLAGTTWTKRGGEITLSHQDTATAIVPEATDYTLGALRSYPTTSPAYAELDRT